MTRTYSKRSKNRGHLTPLLSCSLFPQQRSKGEKMDTSITLDISNLARSLFSFFYSLGTLLGLIGGSLILLSIYRGAITLDKITTALLLHIAVLDISAALIVLLPGSITALTGKWFFGDTFCTFQAYSRYFILSSSGLLVCALNCSKLMALLFPFQDGKRHVLIGHLVAGILWFFSAVFILFIHLQDGKMSTLLDRHTLICDWWVDISSEKWQTGVTIVIVLVPCGIFLMLVTSYWLIFLAVKLDRTGPANFRGALTVSLGTLTLAVSFIPFLTYYIVTSNGGEMEGYVLSICRSIPFLNNVVNVFIYMIPMRRFRRFVKDTLLCCSERGISDVENVTTLSMGSITAEDGGGSVPQTSVF